MVAGCRGRGHCPDAWARPLESQAVVDLLTLMSWFLAVVPGSVRLILSLVTASLHGVNLIVRVTIAVFVLHWQVFLTCALLYPLYKNKPSHATTICVQRCEGNIVWTEVTTFPDQSHY
jgi:hypothetical protein